MVSQQGDRKLDSTYDVLGQPHLPAPPPPVQMHLCLTVECITSGLHLSVF